MLALADAKWPADLDLAAEVMEFTYLVGEKPVLVGGQGCVEPPKVFYAHHVFVLSERSGTLRRPSIYRTCIVAIV